MSHVAVLTPSDVLSSPTRSSHGSASSTGQVDSVALFQMGFDAKAVGEALVLARGDAKAALALLREQVTKQVVPAEEETDEEARELELALQMSLEPQPAAKVPRRAAPSSHRGTTTNPLWAPPRYLPTEHTLEAGPRTLNLLETVSVRDGGYGWQRATAFLDTGNQAMTLVDTRFAARHAIYKADAVPLLSGSSFGMAERWTTLRGVVPGSSTRAPVVTIALKVRDQEMLVPAAVSECTGHDLLLGADVIARLFEAGFRLGAGSM